MPGYIYFSNELKPKSINYLLERFQYYIQNNQDTGKPNKIHLYFSTIGGRVESAAILADTIINLIYSEGAIFRIVIGEECDSAGLLFLAHLKTFNDKNDGIINIEILKYASGVLHAIGKSMHSRTPEEDFNRDIEEMKIRKAATLKFFRKHLTKQEIKDFNDSKNVLLDYARLSTIFNAPVVEFY